MIARIAVALATLVAAASLDAPAAVAADACPGAHLLPACHLDEKPVCVCARHRDAPIVTCAWTCQARP